MKFKTKVWLIYTIFVIAMFVLVTGSIRSCQHEVDKIKQVGVKSIVEELWEGTP